MATCRIGIMDLYPSFRFRYISHVMGRACPTIIMKDDIQSTRYLLSIFESQKILSRIISRSMKIVGKRRGFGVANVPMKIMSTLLFMCLRQGEQTLRLRRFLRGTEFKLWLTFKLQMHRTRNRKVGFKARVYDLIILNNLSRAVSQFLEM